MPAETAAILSLILYAAVAAILVHQNMLACSDGWRLWVLHVVSRLYTPLMFRQRVSGRCPLPGRGPGLVIANHRSPVDPLLIFSGSSQKCDGGGSRVVEYLTASEYCSLGGPVGWIMRVMRVIPVARSGEDMGAVKMAVRRLKQGRLVGVFPEGKINKGNALLPGNPGVAWLALHARVPVYPVFVHDAPQGEHIIQPFHTFCRVRVSYGSAVDLSAYYGQRMTAEILQEVTTLLMARLEATGTDGAVPVPPTEFPVSPTLRVAPNTRAG